MKKRTPLLILVSLLLVAVLTACGGSSDEAEISAAGNVVQAAADAFETGFNNRDLSQFDTFLPLLAISLALLKRWMRPIS